MSDSDVGVGVSIVEMAPATNGELAGDDAVE
jgi:hypothetical protein